MPLDHGGFILLMNILGSCCVTLYVIKRLGRLYVYSGKRLYSDSKFSVGLMFASFSHETKPGPASHAGSVSSLWSQQALCLSVSRISGASSSQYILGKKLQLTNVVIA